MSKDNLLFNLDNPEYCQKLIKEYDELRKSVSCNLYYFSELIKTNKKGYSDMVILKKAKRYFPVVDKSYTKILVAFRKLFNDDSLDFKEIEEKVSDLLVNEQNERKTGLNKTNNDFLESLGIEPDLGGTYSSSELMVFTYAFLLMSKCRDMLAKLSTIFALFGDEYHTEGETEDGFQY